MIGGARRSRIGRIVAGLGATLLLTSCTATKPTAGRRSVATAPRRTPETMASTPRVYYAGVEGVKVYSEASGSSKVVGRLSLHETVTRSKLERGYAYVESAKSGLKGWVSNAQLIRRVPTAAAPVPAEAEPDAPTAAEPQEPSGPEPTPPAEETPPTVTATTVRAASPTSTTIAHGITPSIFNPY